MNLDGIFNYIPIFKIRLITINHVSYTVYMRHIYIYIYLYIYIYILLLIYNAPHTSCVRLHGISFIYNSMFSNHAIVFLLYHFSMYVLQRFLHVAHVQLHMLFVFVFRITHNIIYSVSYTMLTTFIQTYSFWIKCIYHYTE